MTWEEIKPIPKEGGSEGEDDLEIWKPSEVGDELEGRYTKKEENVGDNESNLYTIGDKKVWGSVVLDDRFNNINVGALVKIVFKGKPPGKRWHNYAVYVDYDG